LATELTTAKEELKTATEKIASTQSDRIIATQTEIKNRLTTKIADLEEQDAALKSVVDEFELEQGNGANAAFEEAKNAVDQKVADLEEKKTELERLAKDRTRLEVAFYEAAVDDPDNATEEEVKAESDAMDALLALEDRIATKQSEKDALEIEVEDI